MSYSNRPSRRADPTVAPVVIDPRTGEMTAREAFSRSPLAEKKFRESAAGRKLARRKARLTKRFGGAK